MKIAKHDKAIPEAVIDAAEKAIDVQLKAFADYATPLTASDRRKLLKMGPKTFEFVELAHAVAKQSPQLISKSFDMEAFNVDWQDAHNLMGLVTKIRQLLEIIEDIRMTAGSDAERHALVAYADIKAGASRNVPEAKAGYEQLKATYPVKRRKHRNTESEQPEK